MDPVKLRLSTVWLAGCSGCHMSFLDQDERLIELAAKVELCASPLTDVKEFPESDLTLVEGAVASEEHMAHARLVRERSRIVVSFGDCAVNGNVSALRNLYPLENVIARAYRETAATVVGVPVANAVMPTLLEKVKPLHEVVHVDYFLPGCPPSSDEIYRLLTMLLEGKAFSNDGRRFG